MPYSLEIIALQCIKHQEMDGDEIVVKFNDQIMFHWEDTGYRWASTLVTDDVTDFYNFRTNMMRTKAGDVPAEAYADYGFLLTGLSGNNTIQLVESDEGSLFRGGDDNLGKLTVSEANIANEMQQADFTGEGAHYRLTFAVLPG